MRDLLRDDNRIGARPLGQRQADSGNPLPFILAVAAIVPDPVLGGIRTDDNGCNVLDVDRTSVPRRNQQKTDIRNS